MVQIVQSIRPKCGLALLSLISLMNFGLPASNAVAGKIIITYPTNELALPESEEFAGMVAGKAWDMSELYDVTFRYGFYEPLTPPTNGVWSGFGYADDLPAYFCPLFRGIVSTEDAPGYLQYFTWHQPGTPYGARTPINADYFNRISVRQALPYMQRSYLTVEWQHTLLESETNLYRIADGDYARAGAMPVPVPYPTGFRIYDFGLTNGSFEPERIPHFSGWDSPTTAGVWSGTIYGLSLVPSLNMRSGLEYQVDWIRLYHSAPENQLLLTWTNDYLHGQTNDISFQLFVATNNVGDEGDLFLSGIFNDGQLTFHAGALPPGDYYLYLKAVLDTGTNFAELARSAYSPKIHINARPTFSFISPSFTSGVEYATTDRGNPWDMNDVGDFDTNRTVNITGVSLTNGILRATNVNGDPQVALSLLNPQGVHVPIIPTNYRYLTFRMRFDDSPYPSSAFSSWYVRNNTIGGVARLQWVYTDFLQNQSYTKDIVLHEGWNDYTVDLWDSALLETRPTVPPSAGWTNVPEVNYFIFHPMEPSVPIAFELDYIKLCAPNRPQSDVFPIRWICDDADGDSLAISLYFGRGSGTNFSGTLIAALTNQLPGSGEYLWNTADVPAGEYTLRAVISDGLNALTRDALVPVVVGQPAPRWPTPTITADEVRTNFSTTNGALVTIAVALDPGDYVGVPADWWVVALDAGNNQWYYLDASINWMLFDGDFANCHPAYQGGLFALAETPVLSAFPLPVGTYYFYFAVDAMDGVLNYPAGPIVYDYVMVVVSQ